MTARIDAVLGDPFARAQFLDDRHRTSTACATNSTNAAIEEAHRVAKMPLGEREDLTNLPIVAIDPEDARDHDDAIWASPRDDGEGWDAIVAIADVSFYVREGIAARPRGACCAATASISPTAWCRCCPTNCRPTSAR